jgi:hypothetical protein
MNAVFWEVIALTPRIPDPKTMLAALYAGGPDLRINRTGQGAVVQLCTDDGRRLLSIEAPRYIQVPGEMERLLGSEARTETSVWWTEVRASTGVPQAARLAGSVAGRLAALLDGLTWPREVGRTDVVTVPAADDIAVPEDASDEVLAESDLLTDQSVVVLHDRPILAATTWLTELLRTAARTGRHLYLITPPGTRLTLPARTLLERAPARWVVRDPATGYYDGLTGLVLRWHEGHFTPAVDWTPAVADAYQPPPGPADERQLLLSLRTVHPADDRLLLGGALEAAWQTLTGEPPAGWSTAEPVNVPWSRRQLTDLARTRARGGSPTWTVAVGTSGRPAIAAVRVVRTRHGVEEHITLALGYGAGQSVPLDLLPGLAEELVTGHGLATMITELRAARADLTTPAHFEPPPIPVSLTLGPDAVADLGLERARSALSGLAPAELGPAARPGLHCVLGDGTDPAAWQRLKLVNEQLSGKGR